MNSLNSGIVKSIKIGMELAYKTGEVNVKGGFYVKEERSLPLSGKYHDICALVSRLFEQQVHLAIKFRGFWSRVVCREEGQ
jgi:hypothetical protein